MRLNLPVLLILSVALISSGCRTGVRGASRWLVDGNVGTSEIQIDNRHGVLEGENGEFESNIPTTGITYSSGVDSTIVLHNVRAFSPSLGEFTADHVLVTKDPSKSQALVPGVYQAAGNADAMMAQIVSQGIGEGIKAGVDGAVRTAVDYLLPVRLGEQETERHLDDNATQLGMMHGAEGGGEHSSPAPEPVAR